MGVPRTHNPFMQSLFTSRPAVTSITTSSDEDGSRRKRRRTDSPDSVPEHRQGNTQDVQDSHPQASGSGKPSPLQIESSTGVLSSPRSESATHVVGANVLCSNAGMGDQVSSIPTVHEDAVNVNIAPPHQKPMRKRKPRKKDDEPISMDPLNVTEVSNKRGDAPSDSTPAGLGFVESNRVGYSQAPPSTKMIKARPDGKLSSPKTPRRASRLSQAPAQRQIAETKPQEDPRKMIKVRADGKLVSPKGPKCKAEALAEQSQETDTTQGAVSPIACISKAQTPKKLMKVRSDGRLASPKSPANTDVAPKKRRGRPRKAAGAVTEDLVIIKYSKTEESRVEIGQKIQEILSRSRHYPGPEMASRPAPRSPEPPKATHPFFLGKLMQKPQAHSLGPEHHGKTDNSTGVGSGHERSTSPAKRASPRKSVANVNGGFCASMRGLGQDPIVFGGSQARRSPGALDPIWPPQGMVHVRPDSGGDSNTFSCCSGLVSKAFKPSATTKLKHVGAKVTENEEVLYPYITITETCRTNYKDTRRLSLRSELLRVPSRKVMKGHELQRLCHERNTFQMLTHKQPNQPEAEGVDELSGEWHQNRQNHPALSGIFDSIPKSQTAFDRFECEAHDWTHKYAPKKAEEVLQPGQEAVILRDWLRSLAVNAIDRGSNVIRNTEDFMRTLKRPNASVARKKRKRAEKLDGFVVSSDEEANAMDELNDDVDVNLFESEDKRTRRTVLRMNDAANLTEDSSNGGKSTNAVVISGPNGCGKTAAVYAAAQELGFEVFEINAGSRRSGKDILDKVGDMSRNHLVSQTGSTVGDQTDASENDLTRVADAVKRDIETGRQGTMNAFLQPEKDKKKSSAKDKHTKKNSIADAKSKQKIQKQSVILLEEVDILFEEDKQFWATILELIMQSRRPLVMTCTDEGLLPLNDLPLFGILRFRQPPTQLATEYLLLLACNEGHLISKEGVTALYRAKCNDLRASITELQFFCQMAVGDVKGGLEWMLIQPSSKGKDNPEPNRVVSDGTYLKGIGWAEHNRRYPEYGQKASDEIDVVSAVCNGWGVDLANQDDFLPAEPITSLRSINRTDNFRNLASLDLVHDALSAADILHCPGFRMELTSHLDTTTPEISEKDRANYVEGSTLVQTDVLTDHSRVSDSIAAALRVLGRRTLLETAGSHSMKPLDEQYVIDVLPDMVQARRRPKPVTPQSLSTAFTPLSKPSRGSAASRGPFISNLDGPSSSVVEDIAPYVRAIVSYDLRLEEQRRQLELASQNGRDGKRARTTRASRAALEGGNKANTRRERWFPTNTDFQSILESGGKGWQEAVLKRSMVEGSDAIEHAGVSRRPSTASTGSRVSGV
ncbi:MAG: hypothetical protein Q9225_005678 [Loekoesia sp. 1 TL-2023]